MIARFALSLAATAAVALLAGTAHAQNDAAIAPTEVLTCRFIDGKGIADVDGLATAFNAWMERSRAPAYSAYVLTPQAYSPDIDFDLVWVGRWRDGATMGESMAHRAEREAEIGPAFDSVLRCASRRNFSTVTLREPNDAARLGPVEVATCTLRLGAEMTDALQAVSEWAGYTATTGSTAAHWLLFPAYGERSDARYNFKWAIGYESYPAFGRDYDQLTNGESLDKYNELLGALLRCDSPRLYAVRTIRAPQG
jgi:hypothetical protein